MLTYDYMNMQVQKYWSFPSSYDQKKKQETLNLMLYSNEYVASEKKDGYLELFIKDDEGNLTMRARSAGVNGWVCKQDWIPHLRPFLDSIPNGTVLVGEVYLPGKTSKAVTTILGCGVDKAIQRQNEGTPLHLSLFDILAYDGKEIHSLPMTSRITALNNLLPHADASPYVSIVTYWDNPEDIRENWLRILSEGGEGVVLTKKNNPYGFGKRTAKATLKLKKELSETIDVFLSGRWKESTKEYSGSELETWPYWYDEIKEERVKGTLSDHVHLNAFTPVTRPWYNGWAGAVEIATIFDGEVVPIGWISGITDEVKEGIVKDNDAWKNRVIELQAMEIAYNSGVPALRHARIIAWRTDKNWQDCIWEG